MKNRNNNILILLVILTLCFVSIIQTYAEDQSKDILSNKIYEMANEIAMSILGHKESGKIVIILTQENTTTIDPILNDLYSITSRLLTNLSEDFKVIDKSMIGKLLDELNLGSSSLTESTIYVKIGQITGADVLVTGSVSIHENNVYLTLKAIDINSSIILTSTHTSLPLKNLQSFVSENESKKKIETKPSYFIDKVVIFVTQNWTWLWTIIFLPIGGWLLRFWRKKTNKERHNKANSADAKKPRG